MTRRPRSPTTLGRQDARAGEGWRRSTESSRVGNTTRMLSMVRPIAKVSSNGHDVLVSKQRMVATTSSPGQVKRLSTNLV